MPEYLRLYQSVVDPDDVAEMRRLFAADVAPVFAACRGCLSVELAVSVEMNAGGLVEGATISRWSSLHDMQAAFGSREVSEAIVRLRQLLRQEPVSKVLEVQRWPAR